MIEPASSWLRRHGRMLLIFAVLGWTGFQFGRVLHAEHMITGGGLCLPLDDSFIYLQYSRAAAEGHPFVYTPGNAPTTGATSLWYPLLLLPPHLLRLDPSLCIAWALALGVLGYVVSALLLVRLGRTLGGPLAAGLALVWFLVSPHLMWGYWSGMEIALYATVVLATVTAYLRERAEARFPTMRWWVFALAGGRPEGAVLCGVFGVLMIADRVRANRAGRSQGRVLSGALLLPFAAMVLPFLVNLAVSGSIESTSSQAKSILAEPYRETRSEYLRNTPRIWSDIVSSYASQFLLDARNRPLVPMVVVGGLGALAFLVFGFRRRAPWDSALALLLLLGAGVVVNSIPVYWAVQFFRYQQGLFPVVLLVLASGWARLAGSAWDRLPRALGAPVAAIALIAPLVVTLPRLWSTNAEIIQVYGHNCENILHQQVKVGQWVEENLPPRAIVGLNDAGAIAYYGRRSTVDLVGLTTAGFPHVYRSGLGCLFEHIRRLPANRLPTYFAIYPEWFPYWRESGILGPEAYRAHLGFNTICGEADAVVYPASWIDVKPTDIPVLHAADTAGKRRVDSLDLAWLEDEARHEWKSEPEAKDVLRQYVYADVRTRPLTDAGRILSHGERFRATVEPGKDLLLIMRTDAWYPTALRVTVDGKPAGVWSFARAETCWVEPAFTIPGALLTSARPWIRLERVESSDEGAGASAGMGRDYAPFHYWMYQ